MIPADQADSLGEVGEALQINVGVPRPHVDLVIPVMVLIVRHKRAAVTYRVETVVLRECDLLARFILNDAFGNGDRNVLQGDHQRNPTPNAGPLKRMSWTSLSSFMS